MGTLSQLLCGLEALQGVQSPSPHLDSIFLCSLLFVVPSLSHCVNLLLLSPNSLPPSWASGVLSPFTDCYPEKPPVDSLYPAKASPSPISYWCSDTVVPEGRVSGPSAVHSGCLLLI